ncbi:MAG: methyl-accepting chemotaxis protein [Pseudomonadales bacterium]|nr:methyl-accepting chemotaxis protein [Pseudomonadales bacterium]
MVDQRPGLVGSILKKPAIAFLVVALVLCMAGFGGAYYLSYKNAQKVHSYLHYASQLNSLSQQIAKNAAAAADGQLVVFPLLNENQRTFSTYLRYLKDGNPRQGLPASDASAQVLIAKISALWTPANTQIDIILSNRDSLEALRDNTGDLTITMAAIQQENNKIVASMLRLNIPANQIALAQRQNLLVERMSRNVDKVVQQGSGENLSSSFNRDSKNFAKVLQGLRSGNRDLLLSANTNPSILASLTKIEELSRTVSTQMEDISRRSEDVILIKRAAMQNFVGAAELLNLFEQLHEVYSDSLGKGIASPLLIPALAGSAFFIVFIISWLIYREASRNVNATVLQNERNQSAILQLLDELADLADGDLRVQATVTESFTGAIADSINFSIDQLRSLVSKINEASTMVSAATEMTQSSLGQLSEASQRQAKKITDVSEAVNEMTVSIDMVSVNAAESTSVAERSVGIANKGASVVQDTIDGMDNIRGQIQETAKRIKRLGESSQEIGDIVSLINDIADQTNILSLNAAIQASMAGDAGKGFAVVADEVQRLAERSGAAAKQISALVKTIQSNTNEAVTSMEQTTTEVVRGTRLAQHAGVALGEIESVSDSLAEIIGKISASASQQAASAGNISNTMKSIDEITSQTNDGTSATVTAVGNLADIANELRASVTGFTLPKT